MFNGKKILIGISGSIAAYKACELISNLKKQKAEVRVIASDSALQFIGKASLEGLSGEPVLTSDFSEGHMMDHIHLTKWADIFVIAPATAQTLNSLSSGTGHGILTSSFLAWDLTKPMIVAPAMNTLMLAHPTTQDSLKKLKEMGVEIMDTDSGQLACGDVGLGRLIAPEKIVERLKEIFFASKKLSILITAGGTKVPIDSVRSITNTSTGQTGSGLADFFTKKGYQVDLLLSKNGFKPSLTKSITYFETYDDLKNSMHQMLKAKTYDYVLHAAAVSDYTVDMIKSENIKPNANPANKKLPSGAEMLILLKPTDKIVAHIKEWSPSSQVIAFKLTSTTEEEQQQAAVKKLFLQPIDWVIHNDFHEISDESHTFAIYGKTGKVNSAESKNELALNIEKTIFQKEFL
jgi:phosphopantothenoylcysteine decarboxylase / phosphopantothenate---cysteine ligase